MATQHRIVYGPGGFDPTKPNSNVVDTGTDTIADPPAGVLAAYVVVRNRLTGQGVQPTDTQVINALCVLMARESHPAYERAAVTSESSLGLLNSVQAMVIALAVSLLMWRAAEGIVAGKLTLGDLVMVNALLIQLYIPLNFLGVMYREIKQALVDMEKMFRLLGENRKVTVKM